MGGISLLAASLVVAALGFGWVNAVKDGVFDVWSSIRGVFYEVTGRDMPETDDVMMEDGAMAGEEPGEETVVDQAYDEELDELEAELDELLEKSEAELDALEKDI